MTTACHEKNDGRTTRSAVPLLCAVLAAAACSPSSEGSGDAGSTSDAAAIARDDASGGDAHAVGADAEDTSPEDAAALLPGDAALAGDAGADAGAQEPDAEAPGLDAESPGPDAGPRTLPFSYTRNDVGTPVSAAELAAATDAYLAVLSGLRYFELVDLRAHGWPESDPRGRPSYATWWSGVTVVRSGGQVSYVHNSDGADNNGIRTAPLLEGACYAWRTWRKPEHELLLRRLMRGTSSWLQAMQRSASDPDVLMCRSSCPEPVLDSARGLYLDTSAERPGVDGPTGEFVHVPGNPSWPDEWIRSKRSKDDIGHIQRAIAQTDTCSTLFSSADGAADLERMRSLHVAWAQRVIADGLRIATLDKSLAVTLPSDQFAFYVEAAECPAVLAIRLMATGAPVSTGCGDGNRPPELGVGSGSAMQIVRSSHEAAANLALLAGDLSMSRSLLEGLAKRIETLLLSYELGSPPANINKPDLAALIVHSANAGVPLTSREVRFLHARFAEAAAYVDGRNAATLSAHAPGTPDGTFAFEPAGGGMNFVDLGAVLGTCAAQYANPAGRPVLDCARVAAAHPW